MAPLTHPLTHMHTQAHARMHTPSKSKEAALKDLTVPSALNCFSLWSLCFQVGGVRSVTLPESLLFVSTLDGSLHAVSKQSGDIKWTLREGSRTVNSRLFIILHVFFFNYFLMSPKLNRVLIPFRSHYSSPRVPHRVGNTGSQHLSLHYTIFHHLPVTQKTQKCRCLLKRCCGHK